MAAEPDNPPPDAPLCSDAGRSGIEAIHFSKKSERKSKLPDVVTQSIVWAALAIAFVVAGVIIQVATLTGLLGGAAKLVLAVAVLAAVLPFSVWQWRVHHRIDHDADPAPDPNRRLCCVGRRGDIEQHGPFADVTFEVQVFGVLFSQRLTAQMHVIVVVLASALFVVAFFVVVPRVTPILADTGVVVAFGCVVAARLVVGWLWPTYFRVMPGRLDVMRFSTLRGRAISFERFDLRQAWVLVDLRRSVVFINEGDKRAEYAIGLMPGRTRFAHALFWAAMNTHTPPDLPEDRLLG